MNYVMLATAIIALAIFFVRYRTKKQHVVTTLSASAPPTSPEISKPPAVDAPGQDDIVRLVRFIRGNKTFIHGPAKNFNGQRLRTKSIEVHCGDGANIVTTTRRDIPGCWLDTIMPRVGNKRVITSIKVTSHLNGRGFTEVFVPPKGRDFQEFLMPETFVA